MSSWKNANKAHQKPHRERHQPEERKHLGELEKHKQYKLRASDFNKKKRKLQYLNKKALERNPDEFYFHMINSKVEDGIHKEKGKEITLTPEQLKLMQTQDLKYIGNRRMLENKKVERMKSSLHFIDEEARNKHTFFVDDVKDLKKFKLTKRLDTPAELISRRYNRLRHEDLEKLSSSVIGDIDKINEVKALRERSYKELEQRSLREKKLLVMQQKMEVKKTLQDKKRTILKRVKPETPDSAPVYVWKKERKK